MRWQGLSRASRVLRDLIPTMEKEMKTTANGMETRLVRVWEMENHVESFKLR